MTAQRVVDDIDDAAAAELPRRRVDRDTERRGRLLPPSGELAQRLFDDPIADRNDEAALLQNRDERAWRNQASRRVTPAYERLDAMNAERAGVVNRLIVKDELVFCER